MVNVAPNEERIFRIFKYCTKAFGAARVKIGFPKNTDPRKTYKWRCIESFCDKVDEWGISEATAYKVIDAMVEHAKRHGHLQERGLYILTSDNMLKIGLKSINQKVEAESMAFERIRQDIKFLQSLPNPNKVQNLLKKDTPLSSPSIVKWYMQGELSEYIISLSKSCLTAINSLTKFEQSLIPSLARRIEIQQWSRSSAVLKNRLKLMLGNDWGLTW